jgi:hypothetical protein
MEIKIAVFAALAVLVWAIVAIVYVVKRGPGWFAKLRRDRGDR